MFKTISACGSGFVCGGGGRVFSQLLASRSEHAGSGVKADRLDSRVPGAACSQRSWPYLRHRLPARSQPQWWPCPRRADGLGRSHRALILTVFRIVGARLCLALLLSASAAAPAPAQVPPSPAELKVYAGLHAAAARGNVAEIERLIAAGEKPNIQDARAERRCMSPPSPAIRPPPAR